MMYWFSAFTTPWFTGVISKDPAVKLNKAQEDIRDCAFLQKELIISAVDSLNANTPGGAFMVYCTCSLMVAENEEVVDYILRKRNVKVVDTGLPIGEPGFTKFGNKKFDDSIKLTRRYYPHKHDTDGFYGLRCVELERVLRRNLDFSEFQVWIISLNIFFTICIIFFRSSLSVIIPGQQILQYFHAFLMFANCKNFPMAKNSINMRPRKKLKSKRRSRLKTRKSMKTR